MEECAFAPTFIYSDFCFVSGCDVQFDLSSTGGEASSDTAVRRARTVCCICFTLQRFVVPWKTLLLIEPELMWSPSSTEERKGGGSSSVWAQEKCLLLYSTEGAISRLVGESVEPKKIRLNSHDAVSSMEGGWRDIHQSPLCNWDCFDWRQTSRQRQQFNVRSAKHYRRLFLSSWLPGA